MLDLQWPYKRHASVFAGTQQYAEAQGWHSIIDEFVHGALPTRRGKHLPYDGVIARANHPLAQRAKQLKLPVVNVWANSPARFKLPGVFPDFRVVGRLCAEHLLSRGLSHFATLTPPKNVGEESLAQEFMRTVNEEGFSCVSSKYPQNPWRDLTRWSSTVQAIKRCVDAWSLPIGIYVTHDEVGRIVAQECQRRGLRVPADVAIVAGQNEETFCEHPRPSLTSMEIGYERVGYEAARLLHDLMDGKPAPRRFVLLPPQGLVVRESTDFYAVDNELVAAALSFISANSHRPIGQDDVSKAVGAETRTLQNKFRKYLGRPIVAEIRRVRLERAKRELVQSKRRLSDIARDVGFGAAMRMYDVFCREMGVTPSEYRKQRQLSQIISD